MIGRAGSGLGWSALMIAAAPLAAAPAAAAPSPVAPVPQTADQAWAQDGAEYARRFGVSEGEAVRRLRALHASAPFTDAIRQTFGARLVGVSIDHQPTLRIAVLLAGPTPVTATRIGVEGVELPIEFRIGAPVPATTVVRAIIERQPQIEALIPRARGMGLDPRSGDLVILLAAADAARSDLAELRARAEAVAGVRVRFERADGTPVAQTAPDQADGPPLSDPPISDPTTYRPVTPVGGGRLVGINPGDGKRYACTAAFAVTDGIRSGLATAAHCPDSVEFRAPGGARLALGFVGQWGVSTQDVQLHVSPGAQPPLFQTERSGAVLRQPTGVRSRMGTRGGEWLCRQGDASGFSCAEVEMIHFAPPTPLCAGRCAPTWVTVRTPICRSGDSGGPVFSGPIAFGIHKGGSSSGTSNGGRCNFTFYMSTDFLPDGWRLML